MANSTEEGGLEALRRLTTTQPPLFVSPSADLAVSCRQASQYLFASLKPYTPESPFDNLLTDGFDAEQIWQQIDLQSQPLIPTLRREIKRYEANPDEILKFLGKAEGNKKLEIGRRDDGKDGLEEGSDEMEELNDSDDVSSDPDDEDLEGFNDEEGESGGEEEEEEEEEEKEEEEGKGDGEGIEDKFLKIKELEKYLNEGEAREYGLEKTKKKNSHVQTYKKDGEEDDEDEEDEDEDLEELAMLETGEDDEDDLANARYEDFFGSKGKASQKKSRRVDMSNGSYAEDEGEDDKKDNLSTYEKHLEKVRAEIDEMEKANMEPKAWIMQGEVTAAKRPKNSALEVDLDFEHNARPPPVITEEVTASIEEIIKKRLIEGRFDNVQRAPKLPTHAPREFKELDDNKSKKGLAEEYEEEYAKKTGLVSASLSFSDELKKEASTLFKKLCLKLDALSHFHFAPKPVVEDMCIQTNVPALAMEEIAPVAVSDAAMLAPEEVFAGKGDIKEEPELTQADRKRRRAKKKRVFKAEQVKRTAKKARQSGELSRNEDKDM